MVNNQTTIIGIAYNRKGGAVVESNTIHYWIEGKDSWEDKFLNKEVIVTGTLQKRNDNPVFVDTSDIKSQGIPVATEEEMKKLETRIWIVDAKIELK